MRSLAFPNNQINQDSSTCTRCNKPILNEPIQWSQCNHVYCSSCVQSLIAHHLRVFSTLPTCIHSKCDQALNLSNIPSLSIQYSTVPTTSFHEYTKRKMLIEGYMRNIDQFIPSYIVSLVSDYHHINLHKPTPCVECKHFLRVPISKSSSNSRLYDCYQWHIKFNDACRLNIGDWVDHRDEMGRFRHAVIVDKQSTNLRIHYESDTYPIYKWCDFSDLSELRRFAKYNSLTKRPCNRKEFKFNEIRNNYKVKIRRGYRSYRWFSGHIEEIDETSAQVLVRYQKNGSGEGLFWTHLDNEHEIKPDHSNFYDSKSIHCSSCKGDKICMTLNLRKLCNTQLQCVICNKYHPRNSIMHWTNCHHVVCVDCLLPYAKSCVTERELPICPDVNCKQEIGGNNFNFISYHNKNICNHLKTLFKEKYRFKCVYCKKWHDNSELSDNIDCDHKYRASCRDVWSAYGYTDCVECVGKCELCQDYSRNKRLRKWGLCRHKYHISCAKHYIDSWLPQKRGFIAGIFCKNKTPLCVNKDCGSFLDDKCAEKFHITRYQMRMLNELRNEITYNFDDKWVQIDFKDIEGFEASG